MKTNGEATLTVDGAAVGDSIELTGGRRPCSWSWCRASTTPGSGWPPSSGARRPSRRTPSSGRWPPPGRPTPPSWSSASTATGRRRAATASRSSCPGRQVELIDGGGGRPAAAPSSSCWPAPRSTCRGPDPCPAVLWGWLPGPGGRARRGRRALRRRRNRAAGFPARCPPASRTRPSFLDAEPGVLRYAEGVFTGHRWYDARGIEPAFPFGFGLGYTTWAITTPVAPAPVGAGRRGRGPDPRRQHRRPPRSLRGPALPRASRRRRAPAGARAARLREGGARSGRDPRAHLRARHARPRPVGRAPTDVGRRRR